MSFASVVPTSVHAYTPEQQQACTPDAMRLCGDFVPDVDRITACMIQKKSQLSAECRRHFRPGPEPGEASAGPPPNFKRVGAGQRQAGQREEEAEKARQAGRHLIGTSRAKVFPIAFSSRFRATN